MREYSIRITNCNEDTVCYFDKLNTDDMLAIVTKIVIMSGYFMDVKVTLK